MTMPPAAMFWSDGKPSEWRTMRSLCMARADSLRQERGTHVLIQSEDSLQVLAGVYSALLAQKVAVLDPKRQVGRQCNGAGPAYINWESVSLTQPLQPYPTADVGWATTGQVVFYTSGSTGEPQPVVWEWSSLLKEAEHLLRFHNFENGKQGGVIVGLVGPMHIYGLLHLFLLPLLCGAQCWFIDPRSMELPANLPKQIDLLVTVPALWQLSSRILDAATVDQMVSSAGVFDRARCASLRAHARKPRCSVEIFGSTETGGIGHRLLDPDENAFQLFPGVRLEYGQTHAVVHTPYRDEPVMTADQLTPLTEQTFRYLGRTDRVFKYAGQRLSLSQIEVALLQALAVDTFCAFVENPQRAQGGDLIAFVETSVPLSVQEVRQRMAASSDLPLPNQVVCVTRLPRDANGKIQLVELMKSLT